MTQQDAIVTNDRHQIPDARAPNREVRRADRPANLTGHPAAPTDADAWRERKRERVGLYNTVIGRYLADARATALAHDTENARSPVARPAAEDVDEPFFEIPYVPAPYREVRRPDRPANPRGRPAAREHVLTPLRVANVDMPAEEDAHETSSVESLPSPYIPSRLHEAFRPVAQSLRPTSPPGGDVVEPAVEIPYVPAPNREVRRPDRPANRPGHPAARGPVLVPRLVAGGRGVGVPVVGGAGRAPAEFATARRIQAEGGVAAEVNQVATPGAVTAQRAIAPTPAVGVPVVGGAESPVLPAVTLAQALAALDTTEIEAATPATGAAQQAQPSENAEAETIPVIPASPFSQLNFDQKIQALLVAADNQINQAKAYDASYLDLVATQVGSRNLTAKECLGFALEIALEERRAQVPDISLRLTRILNAEDQIIPLFGVNFPRARIEAWSREESLPEPIQVHQEFMTKDNQLGTASAGSVHSKPVKAVGKKQLNVMKNRTAIGSQKTVEQTATEIRGYIATLPFSESALNGLNKIMRYTGGQFNENSAPTLAIVWGYIEQCSNQDMKQNLRDSMIIKLAEIATENPCSDGIIQRILDIPTAIDLSLPQDIPEEEVLRELAQMAGNVNEYFEENYAFDCTGARAAAGEDETSPGRMAVEATISDLKRGMFLEKARIELVVLRNIDSNFVMETADKVFPKGAIL